MPTLQRRFRTGFVLALTLIIGVALLNFVIGEREDPSRRAVVIARLGQLTATAASISILVVVFRRLRRENALRREAAARESDANRFLDSIVENIPNMVFVKDAKDLRFVRFNRAGERLLGLTRDQLVGKSDRDLFPASQADAFQSKDREVLANKDIFDIPEEPIDTPSGQRWLHTRKIPITDDDGTPLFLLGISEDITIQKQASDQMRAMNEELERRVRERTAALEATEIQLRQSQKLDAIGRLAGGIAHDFNNLLSVILSYSEMLVDDLKEGQVRDDVQEIHNAGKRAADLTRQLLAFSRQQVLAPKILDVNELLGGMDRLLRRVIGEHIELRTLDGSKIDKIKVDPGQLEQVIMNLVVNARDAMPRGGTLTLETANVELDQSYAATHAGVEPGAYVMLAVTDTGVGMDKDIQARIFEPFFTTKPRGKGTGLGLSTVFGIIKQSGGTVWCYSEPGTGTTFKIYFPRAPDVAPATRAVTGIAAKLHGTETILLVEDESQVRALARTVLVKAGFQVLEATNGEDALMLCERFAGTIHLVLTDVVMPKMGGRELVERLQVLRPATKVLYMSGYTDDTVVHHGVLDEGVAFLQKPITPEALTSKIRDVLDES